MDNAATKTIVADAPAVPAPAVPSDKPLSFSLATTEYKPAAANTNEPPLYIGQYMVFSDQDLTALKHNLVGTAMISTVFVGLLSVIGDHRIPLPMRMAMMAVMVTGLHASTIALWNLVQSHLQLHPNARPDAVFRLLSRNRWVLTVASAFGLAAVWVSAPMIIDAFNVTAQVIGIW